MAYLLDTNTCIDIMRRHPYAVMRLAAVSPGECYVSSVTVYELLTGVAKCNRPAAERQKLERLLSLVFDISFDATSAHQSAMIRVELERVGQKIGPYDVMIAGHARAEGMVLVTNNRAEFSRVRGLTIEDWLSPTP
jgi:tRNA(fMet)-specific endonuclease VapC